MKTMSSFYNKTVRLLGLLGLVVALMVPAGSALAEKGSFMGLGGVMGRDPIVNVMLGKAEMVEIGGDVADLLVADPSIVDVMAVRSNRVYVVGSALGETNIMALDQDGNVLKRINVHVQMDVEKLEAMVGELYPDEDVTIRVLTDQVVLTGEVSTPSVANSIANLVGHYAGEVQNLSGQPVDQIIVNMLNVRGEQQVMLRVKIVEASRNALRDLGVETNVAQSVNNATNVGLATASGLGLTAPVGLGAMALNFAGNGFGPLNFLVRALEEEGILNTLAEPNLTAISGEQAGFLAGGEFPIPTQIDENGNLVYEFRPFGVSLNFRPVVLSENRISLELTTEVSTASFDQGLQLQGINVPTFNIRRAQTTVEMGSGGTLMIAGLLESKAVSGLTQLPGIGDVPVIGDLMKSKTFTREESEVLVMITPYLVQPFAQNNAKEKLPEVPRDSNELGHVFESNIRRTYGQAAPEKLMSETGSFGYIID